MERIAVSCDGTVSPSCRARRVRAGPARHALGPPGSAVGIRYGVLFPHRPRRPHVLLLPRHPRPGRRARAARARGRAPRGQARQGSEEVAGGRPSADPAGRGEDVPRPEQGRPRRVPEDLLGPPGPRPGDARQRVPHGIRDDEGRRGHAVPGHRPRGLGHRLRAGLHPARRPRRGEARARDRRVAHAGDLDLPGPAEHEVQGRPGPDPLRRGVPAPAGRAAGASR